MRALLLLLVPGLLLTGPVTAVAGDLRDAYVPQHKVPLEVTDVCGQLGPAFNELRMVIDTTGAQSAAAGKNATGLGYWSANKHFRSVEDNYIVVNRMLEPSLDQVTDVPIALDKAPESDARAAALSLAEAYEGSLKQIKDYAHAAVVAERAAYGRRNEQSNFFGFSGSQNRNRNDREMSADEARAILDGQSSDVKDASRKLKLPEYRWAKACPSVPIAHHTSNDSMLSPEPVSPTPSPSPQQ